MAGNRRTGEGQLPVLAHAVITFAWTWSLWWTAAAADRWLPQLAGPVQSILFITGGLGPLVGAAWVVRRGDAVYRRTFLQRVWNPHAIPTAWWLALLAVTAGPAMLGAIAARVTGQAGSSPDYSVAAVASVVAFALAAGLAEEPGWRGAATDAWQARTSPLRAALAIGGLWAVWHLPLYFIYGTYQHGVGLGSVRFWLTNFVLIQLAVLYAWLVNGTGGSILIAILAHAGFNAFGELLPHSTTRDLVAIVLVTITSLAVIARTKGRLGSAEETTRPRQPDALTV